MSWIIYNITYRPMIAALQCVCDTRSQDYDIGLCLLPLIWLIDSRTTDDGFQPVTIIGVTVTPSTSFIVEPEESNYCFTYSR